MRKFVMALAAVASVGLIVPTINSARAEDRVVVKERGDHHHHHWNRHHDKKVVIIKKHRRHHDHD